MRDSNPRGTLQRPTGLANPPLQPLEYLSVPALGAKRPACQKIINGQAQKSNISGEISH